MHTKQGGHSRQAYRFTDLVQPLPTVWNNPSQSSLRTFIALPSQPYSHLLQSDCRYITNWQSILDCTQFIFKDESVQKTQAVSEVHSSFGLYISAEQTNKKCSTRIMLLLINAHTPAFSWKLTYTRMSHNSAVEQNKFYMQLEVKHKLSKHRTYT